MSDQQPLVSIIIPSLQEEKLLERTLRQFTQEVKQRFGLELIVSDGGSTDRTLEIARQYADVIIEAMPQERQNISLGRNRGARAAKGEILVFINADTIIENIAHFFEEMIVVMNRPGLTGATCSVGIYREEEGFSDRVFHGFYNLLFHLENLLGLGMGRGECQVIKRSTFFSIGGYNESMAAGEDFELFVRLRKLGMTAFKPHLRVNESPRRYRAHGYLKTSLLWLLNAVSVVLFRRSLQKEWKPVR